MTLRMINTKNVEETPMSISITDLAGPSGPDVCRAMSRAKAFLDDRDNGQLLGLIGETVEGVALTKTIDKAVMQKSYGGGTWGQTDDLLAGKGLFYLTEQGKLFLDCTAGHYQMTWGYNHPQLTAAILQGIQNGIITDNQSN